MLGPFDYTIWLVGFLAEICVVVCSIRQKQFLHYFSLNLFVLALAADEVLRFVVLKIYGFASLEFRYEYYFTDALLTVAVFLTIMGLYLHVFEDLELARYIRGLAVVILGATSVVSFLVVVRDRSWLSTRFFVELSQNLYFTGVILTYILWLVMFKRGEARTRIVLIVSAFGVFFSAHAVTYALRGMFPSLAIWRVIPPLLGMWLPLSLAYTFIRIPEEARMGVRTNEKVRA